MYHEHAVMQCQRSSDVSQQGSDVAVQKSSGSINLPAQFFRMLVDVDIQLYKNAEPNIFWP